ncbi:MAG: DEAD/DEAH box helicase [Oceanipulchritudo sp.]|jgi:ATP-dependent RNA helicase RhlE
MSDITFEAMPLAEPVQRALRDEKYAVPTPIQARSIPPQLEGRDLMGCAQTGTGKTAAFALPILTHLSERPQSLQRGKPRVLVLTPTRELAIQVGKSFTTYGRHLRLRHSLVYGGVSQHPQTRNLAKGVDILVATPGRLLDLMDQGHIDLSGVEFLVLDEVDRMLDMGFVHDVRRIARELPRGRQTVLFTATLTPDVEKIAGDFVMDPVRISVTPDKPVVENIHQQVCFIRQENKKALLEGYLRGQGDRNGTHSTIIFCRTKFGAEKLSKQLNKHGFRSDAIHGDKSQGARQRALDGFRSGKLPILVATDVAARGIDVRSISLVINYDLPEAAESYVHRIGRTARAEAEGNAVSFCTAKDVGLLAQIEKFIGLKIEIDTDHPFHDAEAADHSSHHSKRPHARQFAGKRSRGFGGGKAYGNNRPFGSRYGRFQRKRKNPAK